MENDIQAMFSKNMGILTKVDFDRISNSRIAIIGLGGLGSNLANQFVRLGIKNLVLVDFDRYSLTNLNRQLFSNTENLGLLKVDVIKHELLKINPELLIKIYSQKIQDIELDDIDFIIDATDNIESKLYLCELAYKKNIYLLHGACAGWYGQVGFISPGNRLLYELYGNQKLGLESELYNPTFTPVLVASYMVSEFVKMIKKSSNTAIDALILIDLYNNTILVTKKGEHNG
jgi:molybdopterin/thiamine biosynthesis adenylyltransferase